jgi:phenylalanyl-tRNA synthetase beta chain
MVPIANPLSETFAVLRPSSLPTLLDAVAHNRRREQRDVRLFEIGARFSAGAGETRSVACVWTGTATGPHWSAEEREVDFFDMKGLVERICEGLMAETQIEPTTEPWLVRGRSASIRTNGGGVGLFGQLTAELAEKHGLPSGDAIYVAELDLDALERSARSRVLQVDPLPRFPSITRDISILVDDSLAASEIRDTIRGAASATLAHVREFDRYQGKGVPQGKVSLSLRLTFRSADRTLTDAEVQASMDGVLAALKARHSAVQR